MHVVRELSDKVAQGNAAHGSAMFEDSRNCDVATDKALVALEAEAAGHDQRAQTKLRRSLIS